MTTAGYEILLIEDDEDYADLIRYHLSRVRRFHFSLDWVTSLAAGEEHIKARTPDVVLLDLSLPDSDRRQSFEELETLTSRWDAPVIVLTAIDDPDSGELALKLGAQDFLGKDTEGRYIARAIRYAKERFSARRALLGATQKALSATEAKTDFVSNVSHELRTPLHGVLGMTQLLLQGELSTEQRNRVELIDGCGRQLLGLIGDVLDFSKIEAGKLDIEPEPTHLAQLVEESAIMTYRRSSDNQVELLLDIAPDLPREATVDPMRLRQVLDNLLSNALKFTRRGYVRVSLGYQATPSTLTLAVEDTGIGISEAQLGQIFEPFTQADASISRRFGGTGLGLALVARLLERMGGRIRVESLDGVGTTFFVELPVTSVVPRSPQPCCDGQILLLAEAPLRGLVGRDLEARGAKVQSLGFGDLDRLSLDDEAPTPDAVVVIAPLGCGQALVDRLAAAMDLMPGVPRVACGFSDERCHNRPHTACLDKPVVPSVLHEALRRFLGDPDQAEAHPPVATTMDLGAGKRLLLVDDVDVGRIVGEQMLSSCGFDVVTVADGQQAVARCQSERFDLVMMDCQMPIMDGFEATRAIRRHEQAHGLPRMPIVALTAAVSPAVREMCFDAGMDDVVSKPFRRTDLIRAVQRFGGEVGPDTPTAQAERPGSEVGVPEAATAAPATATDSNDLVAEFRRLFIASSREHFDAILAAWAEGELDVVRANAHKLRGALGTLVSSDVLDLVSRLEAAAEVKERPVASRLLADLSDALTPVLEEGIDADPATGLVR